MPSATLESPRTKGEARDRDEELLLLLALISLADLQLAAQLWDGLMPPQWRGLLGAVTIDDARAFKGQLPPIWFDVKTQRYGLGSRGFITQAAMFRAIDTFRERAAEQAKSDITPVFSGRDIGQWQANTETMLKLVAVAVVAAAVGGVLRVTEAMRETAAESLVFHFERLARFAREIEGGLINLERAEKRAGMYPESIVTNNYDDNRRASHIAAGMTEELNVLADSEHCETTPATLGCADLTELGWVPIGTIPPPGRRTCKMNCKCHMVFRRSEAESN